MCEEEMAKIHTNLEFVESCYESLNKILLPKN